MPSIKCHYDNCCTFEPNVWNQLYCPDHRCKRKEENRRKRLTQEIAADDEANWQLEEKRKNAWADRREGKNKWILENKTFAMVDIESTQLDADFGRLICVGIKPLHGDPIMLQSLKGDKKLAVRAAKEIRKYDYIVTYFGTRFDLPFLTTRLMVAGNPSLGLLRHVDVYYTVRSQLKLAANRQAMAVLSLFGKADRTDVVGKIWAAASEGDKEAVDYIVSHCEADLYDLEKLFLAMVKFRNLGATPVRLY